MRELKCRMCDAHLEVDEKEKYANCSFCGTRFLIDAPATAPETAGAGAGDASVQVNPTAMLERAELFLEDGKFAEADRLLETYLSTVDAKDARERPPWRG